MYSTALLVARAMTTKLSYVPGMAAVLEPVRRWGRQRCPEHLVVNDFDGDLKFELDLADADDSRIFWYGWGSRPIVAALDELLREPGQSVVDAGAGTGEFALLAANRVGSEGRVVAIEPDEVRADRLTRNLALNRFEQVDVLVLEQASLEGLQDEGWFTKLDLLKIAASFPASPLIEGARSLFDEHAPFVLLQGGNPDADDVVDMLSESSYQFFRVDRETGLARFDGRGVYPWALACPPEPEPT